MTDLAALLLSLVLRAAEAQRPRIVETVTVVGADPSIATPAAVTAIGGEALASQPAATLDDALRAVPGFSLFRRSSSRVANPTTQGATLRGLSASGSSRALVLADGVPLNDPVGGWVYWNRVPIVALDEVSVARGASGDLHGSEAVGGVVTLRSSAGPGVRLLAEAGSHVARASGVAGWSEDDVRLVAAAEGFTTSGFVTTAPESRGPIDVPARSRHGSAHLAVGLGAPGARATLRGSHFGEARGNGTPVQTNRTRISQASALLDRGTRFSARGYAQVQRYEQAFSAVAGDRASERRTSAQEVTAAAIGGAADWSWSGSGGSVAISGSGRLVDAELENVVFTLDGARQAPQVTTPFQATGAVAVQASVHGARASAGGGLRAEAWRSALETASHDVFFSPRLWGAYAATEQLSLRLSLQSGHRPPTMNELYRPFRVGDVLTQANAALRPEAVRGVEWGASWRSRGLALRVLGFWSRVDDAITNVTLSVADGLILRQRQNAARIRAVGAEIEVEARVAEALTLTASSSLVDSIFTRGPLDGLRVPQVARQQHALGVRGSAGPLRLSAEWRRIGRQFDDDRNAFALAPSSVVDARAGWRLRRATELFAAMENVADAEQNVGRTPLRTIGLPRTTRAGIRIVF